MDTEHHRDLSADDFRSIIATSVDGFLMVDTLGHIQEANDSYCRMMGYMDGYALFRALKTVDPQLPIIISIGFGDMVITAKIPSAEIAGMISKPYNFEQMQEVLKKALE